MKGLFFLGLLATLVAMTPSRHQEDGLEQLLTCFQTTMVSTQEKFCWLLAMWCMLARWAVPFKELQTSSIADHCVQRCIFSLSGISSCALLKIT